jgi:hypothetical protein
MENERLPVQQFSMKPKLQPFRLEGVQVLYLNSAAQIVPKQLNF